MPREDQINVEFTKDVVDAWNYFQKVHLQKPAPMPLCHSNIPAYKESVLALKATLKH